MKNISKIVFIPALVILLWVQTGKAQEPFRERVYVQTNKNVYVAGEILWLKLYTTDHQGVPDSLSKVGI
ncbi:MAG: hypothetical protein LUD15_11575 [Bacteroides sp.]|nr:hypothetical protein [Bacteroides sp.]